MMRGHASSRIRSCWRAGTVAFRAVVLCAAAWPAVALETLDLQFRDADKGLSDALRGASALVQAKQDRTTDAQDILAAARSEYARLLGVLYSRGHYSAVIRVLVDGREAAGIAPLDAPARIDSVVVIVEPGPTFSFGTARVAPLARDTEMPAQFATGQTAASGLIAQAAQAGIDGWRNRGHAKADVASQDLVADHKARRLDADIRLAPGPELRFGQLRVSGQDRMRIERIHAIAGLPEGARFDPRVLNRVADRLRRTGIFASVALREDDTITPPDLVGISLGVVEMKPRHYSFGAEISSFDGALVSASWLHRNLWGGGERLRISAEVAQIGAQESGMDYALEATLDRPATLTPDTTVGLLFRAQHLDETDYVLDGVTLGVTAQQYISERLTLNAGLSYNYADVSDALGDTVYRNLALPLGIVRDSRDKPLDARTGSFLSAEVMPFLGFDGTDSGGRVIADARAYRSIGDRDRVTFAARFQLGAVLGSTLLGTPRDYLFYSGGGGTVRGQPFQSLGVTVPGTTLEIGGQTFLGASVEARVRVTDSIGVVGFFDWGQIGGEDFSDDLGGSQSGAGLGLRYDTGFGPLRLDVAAPVSGDTDEGVQIYIGIGQAF